MSKKMNVLLLVVDALRKDRLSAYGYDRPTTPNLERMANNSIICHNAFSLGPFTQSACVQLLTSTRPLSYGGYDFGAIGRPPTVFKQFHDAGYRTSCISTLHWVNRFFGYSDGVDQEFQLFGFPTIPGVAMAMIRNSLNGYEKGKISAEEMLEVVSVVLDKFFVDAQEYAKIAIERKHDMRRDFPDSSFVNANYNYKKIFHLINKHKAQFEANKLDYIEKHLLPAPGFGDWMDRWILKETYYCRDAMKLASELIFRAGNKIVGAFNSQLARLRKNRFKVYPDANSIANKVISELENHQGDEPFFIWTHFMDTHSPFVSGAGRKGYKETPIFLKDLGYPDDLDPSLAFDGKPKRPEDGPVHSALYDAAVRSTDKEIGRIVDALERLDLCEDTLVVVCADHGEELGDHGDFGHFFLLYDHNTNVPMMYFNPKFKRQDIMEVGTIMDVAPTITALTGVRPHPQWEGSSVLDFETEGRPPALLETFYGGNCVFEHRPLYFAVRSDKFHYLWREYLDPDDKFSPPEHQLYDVVEDPKQQNNLYHQNHPTVAGFNAIIAERLVEMPEITNERIIAAFDNIGKDAIHKSSIQDSERDLS